MLQFPADLEERRSYSLHLAAYLAGEDEESRKRVLLIDVDHQSSLSIVLLGDAVWQKAVKGKKTVDRVFQSFCNPKIPMPQGELVIKNAFGEKASYAKNFYPTLDFVSAQFELDDTEIDLASTNFGNPTLSEWGEANAVGYLARHDRCAEPV